MENTLPTFLIEYLDYKSVIQNKSKGTLKEYTYDLKHFLQYIIFKKNNNNIPKNLISNDNLPNLDLNNPKNLKYINISNLNKEILKNISLYDIHAFLGYLRNEYNSEATTLSRKVSSIKAFFKYFFKIEKYLSEDPAANLESPKLPKKLPKYLNLEDSKKLLDATKTVIDKKSEKYISRNHAIITLFLNCGFRLSELISLNILDIDFTENKVRITGKGNKERTVFFNNACINALQNYLKDRPKNDELSDDDSKKALFLSNQKKRISRRSVQYLVEFELKKAGLDSNKFSTHKLRHTAATLMYQYGDVDIVALQKVLGHDSISTTEIYTHAENFEAKRAIENNPLSNLD